MAYGSEKLLAQLRYRSSSLAGRVVRKERIAQGQICAQISPRGANLFILTREKVAPWGPMFLLTSSYVFVLLKEPLGMQNCPRPAGGVRNRTVVL